MPAATPKPIAYRCSGRANPATDETGGVCILRGSFQQRVFTDQPTRMSMNAVFRSPNAYRSQPRRLRVWRWLMLVCLFASLAASLQFVLAVCTRPTRTPLLTLCGSYGPAWDLNGWVHEDQQRIAWLRNGALSVTKLADPSQLAADFWDDADATLRQALAACPRQQTCVLYVNLHGAVNDQRQPCLIPPGADPTDAATWLPLQSLLTHLDDAQPQQPRNVLLILECGKLRSWAPAGISLNTFDDQVRHLIESDNQDHADWSVSALSSATVGERSLALTASEDRGNLFTRMVVQGLTGAADGAGQSGKRDGSIDVSELHRFVRQATRQAAFRSRAMAQTPTLHITAAAERGVICFVTRDTDPLALTAPAAISDATLADLQQTATRLQTLARQQPETTDPLAWAAIQRQAHAVAEATFAGQAAGQQLPTLLHKLQSSFQAWESDPLTPISLFADSENFLASLKNRPDLQIWQRSDWQARIEESQTRWRKSAAHCADRLPTLLACQRRSVDRCRRELADELLADGKSRSLPSGLANTKPHESPAERIETKLLAFEASVTQATAWLDAASAARQLRDRAALRLPSLCQWADETQWLLQQPAATELPFKNHDAVQQCRIANDALHNIDQQLRTLESRRVPQATEQIGTTEELHTLRQTTARLTQQLGTLETFVDAVAERSLQWADEPTPTHPERTAGWLAANARAACLAYPLLISANQTLHRIDQQHQLAPDSKQETTLPTPLPMHATQQATSLALSLPLSTERLHTGNAISTDAAEATRQRLRFLQRPASPAVAEAHARLARRMAAGLSTGASNNLFPQLRQQRLRQSLVTQIGVVLDDFWAFPRVDQEPYFAATTKHLLAQADQVAPESADWNLQRAALRERLQARRAAANEGVVLNGHPIASFATDPQWMLNVQAAKLKAASLPAGLATLEQCSADAVVAVTGMDIQPTTSAPTRVTLPTSQLDPASAPLQLNFRGHLFPVLQASRDDGSRRTHSTRRQPTEAKVTVHAGWQQPRAISLVLDCSASMEQAIQGEATRDASQNSNAWQPPTKLDAASASLVTLLRPLINQHVQIGVTFYGHRMAVDRQGAGVLIQQQTFEAFPFSPTIQPFEDVEIAFPAGRFGDAELSLLQQRLAKLVPWGQTPLHLALQRTIQDMQRLPNRTSKDIIVITDGRNYQFNPTPDAVVSREQVVAAARQAGIRIHLIGFGIEDQEATAAATDFLAIAKGSGGQAINDVGSAPDLVRHLKQLTTAQTPIEVTVAGQTQTAALGETLVVPHILTDNTPAMIRVGGTAIDVPVSPGMHLRMALDLSTGGLRAEGYRHDLVDIGPMRTAMGQTVAARVGLHRVPTPLATQDTSGSSTQTVRISFQRDDGLVMDRPTETWIEVAPLRWQTSPAAPLADTLYQTSNAAWLNDQPCPVAEFECQAWPLEASQFAVRVWCHNGDPLPTTVMNVGERTDLEQPLTTPTGNVGSVRYHREGNRLQVSIHHDAPLPNSDPRRIVRLSADVPFDASHWYATDHSSSLHRFTLNDGFDPQRLQLSLIRLRDFKAHSVASAKPLLGNRQAADATVAASPTTTTR